MPQCAKTLKIGSVLLKTGVFKVKNLPNSSKAEKILLFWRKIFKLLVFCLIRARFYILVLLACSGLLTAFTLCFLSLLCPGA